MKITNMKERKQKIFASSKTCPQKDRTASDGYVEGQTFIWITENNLTTNDYRLGNGLLEHILSPSNLNSAYKQVKRNKGAGGVDKMEVESLKDYLVNNKDRLIQSIQQGKYRPNPVRRVLIPKENGKQRQLGIPTVVDRGIQQSIAQKLTSIYEPQFSSHSYGFRPKRSAHGALRKCRDYITQGYVYAVDIDLERYFDTVNHSKLIEMLSRTIKDGRVVSLRVNRDKSQVAHVRDVKFLGYTFYRIKGKGRLRIHPKSVEKMKAKIKRLTSRSNGWGNERRKEALSQYIKGWVQYFKMADMQRMLEKTDAWYRRRLRMVDR